MITIYQKYILRNLLLHFGAVVATLVLLIWFSRAVGFISYITENGVEIKQFFYLFVLILPWIANYIIPISLFIAFLICFSRLALNNEITILKGCGLSNLRIAKPAIYLALFAAFICYLNSFYLAPYANKKLRVSKNEINGNYVNLSFNPQTFETFKKTTIYSQQRDLANNLYGVFIHNDRLDKTSLTITAKSGKLMANEDGALMYLNNGTMQRFNRNTKKSEILVFDSYVFNLAEQENEVSQYNWKPGEKYFHELLNGNEGLSQQEIGKIRSEISQRILGPLANINLAIIAIAFLLSGKFRRGGGLLDRVYSVVTAVFYLTADIFLFQISETKQNLLFLPYVNFLIFFVAGLFLLQSKRGFSR